MEWEAITAIAEAAGADAVVCPLMALSGHIALQHGCPLSGAKRTPALQHEMSGFDPKRTLKLNLLDLEGTA